MALELAMRQIRQWLIRQLPIEKHERSWVALAFSWFFLLMAGYQILRPIRESLVSDLPSEEKPTLFLVVFFVMLIACLLYTSPSPRD